MNHNLQPTAPLPNDSRDLDIKPYWDKSCVMRNQGLWNPSELAEKAEPVAENDGSLRGIRGLLGSWFTGDLKQVPAKVGAEVSKKWFSYSLDRYSAPEDSGMRCKKIRFYPTAQERETLNKWLQASRFTYNEAVARLKEYQGPTPDWRGEFGKEILDLLPEYVDSPYQVKKIAIRDALAALKEGKKRVKRGMIKRFDLSFRSRKDPFQGCYIPSSAFKENGMVYPRILKSQLKTSEPLPEHTEAMDSRIVKQRDKWYICVPRKTQPREAENQGRVVAIDPGIRNFITLFSERVFGHIGKGDIGKIVTLSRHLDALVSKMSRCDSAEHKRSYKRATNRMRDYIENLVSELHWKAALFLVTNFDVILLPTFETSEMVVKKARKINKKSVRSMLTLSHYKFSQRLIQKAWEYGKAVVRVSEAYTSKTNSWTGEIMAHLGGAKSFKYQGISVDRDLNGARGIFLRALRDTSFESVVPLTGAPDSLLPSQS